jgi:Domain of Unknown Function (DUF1080)
MTTRLFFAVALVAALSPASAQQGDPKLTEVWQPVRIVTPGQNAAPPSDAVVLDDPSQWQHQDGTPTKWTVSGGALTVAKGTGDLHTKRAFGDCQLHIEWRTPAQVAGRGQDRGNSGVYLQSRYELQVLDSYDNPTYANGQAASIYKQHIPLVNASRKPGEWQTYDVVFRGPRFADNGSLSRPAYMTVLHNGVLVQDHAEINGSTVFIGTPRYQRHNLKEPLMLQDHGSPVSYRNIWIRELDQ